MPASRPPFRIAQVDPNEHGATFLGFYERSPQDATPHFRGRGVFGMQTGGNPANAISIPLYERLGFRTVRRYARVRDGIEEPRILMWKDF